MPDDRRIPAGPLDGATHPSVTRASALLRAEVPVRSEWRDRVLAEIGRAALDDIAPAAVPARRRARLVIAWPAAAAAAVLLFGAGVVAARVGARSRAAATDAPAPIAGLPQRGTTRFVLVAPNAHRVALVGDFNLWNPASSPMRRLAGSSEWAIDLPLPAGRHAYAFVVDGDFTADPSAPRTAGDDFGRPNSVVLVSSPRS